MTVSKIFHITNHDRKKILNIFFYMINYKTEKINQIFLLEEFYNKNIKKNYI